MKVLSCTKNIQWSALGGNDKMVMKVLGDKVNRVTVKGVGGNKTAQYLPTTPNRLLQADPLRLGQRVRIISLTFGRR